MLTLTAMFYYTAWSRAAAQFWNWGARKNVARSAKIFLVWPPKIWSGPHLRGGQGGAESVSKRNPERIMRIYCHLWWVRKWVLWINLYLKIKFPFRKMLMSKKKKKRSSTFFLELAQPGFEKWGPPGNSGAAALVHGRWWVGASPLNWSKSGCKYWVQKKIRGVRKKNLGVKKKLFWSKKNFFGQKTFFFGGQKNIFWSKNNFWGQIFFLTLTLMFVLDLY